MQYHGTQLIAEESCLLDLTALWLLPNVCDLNLSP